MHETSGCAMSFLAFELSSRKKSLSRDICFGTLSYFLQTFSQGLPQSNHLYVKQAVLRSHLYHTRTCTPEN